jgi:hypothetical protein
MADKFNDLKKRREFIDQIVGSKKKEIDLRSGFNKKIIRRAQKVIGLCV